MPRPRPSLAELLLDAEVALLEAELDLTVELITAGYGVPGHREPMTHEVVAGVRFAELERIVEDTYAQLARIGDRVRGEVLDRLALDLGDPDLLGDDPTTVGRRLADLADPTSSAQLPGLVEDVLIPARAEAAERLDNLHRAAGQQALDEAARQGATGVELRTPAAPSPRVRQLLDDRAGDLVLNPYRRLVEVARAAAVTAPPTATSFDVFALAVDAAEGASTAGTEDLARRAASVAHDEGRTATLTELAAPATATVDGDRVEVPPLVPAHVYSSELLDRNTCRPCSLVDGRDYVDLEEAHRDYPGNGGFHACEGRDRCRGTLVIVWQGEAGPTVDQARRDDPDAPPIPPATPPTPPRPPVGELDDETLMRELGDAVAAGDETAMRELGGELDRRDEAAAATLPSPARAEADDWAAVTADVRAEYARNPDAYLRDLEEARRLSEEVAGGALDIVRGAASGPRGRRIDRVRSEWDEEVERRYIEAEAECNGDVMRKDRAAEFGRKYGAGSSAAVLFDGPARVGYYYASEELRRYWAAHPRLTFAEFAAQRGVRDAKTLDRARRAAEARDDAILRAEEDPEKRAARRRDTQARRSRIPATEADRLRRAQARAARERKQAADLARRLGREDA